MKLTRKECHNYVLLFNDEASVYRQPTAARLHAPKGRKQPPMRLSHSSNTRTRIMGVLNAVSGEVLHKQASKAGVKQLSSFYKQVLEHYKSKQKIYLVWDNWPIHYHHEVMKVLLSDERVVILSLPTYSPWLNPIEKLWRWLKQQVTHTHDKSNKWLELKNAITQFLDTRNGCPDELLRYVGLAT